MRRACLTPLCPHYAESGQARCPDHQAYLRANPRCEQCGAWARYVTYRVPRTAPLEPESLCQRCFYARFTVRGLP